MDLPFVNVLCVHREVPALLPQTRSGGLLSVCYTEEMIEPVRSAYMPSL